MGLLGFLGSYSGEQVVELRTRGVATLILLLLRYVPKGTEKVNLRLIEIDHKLVISASSWRFDLEVRHGKGWGSVEQGAGHCAMIGQEGMPLGQSPIRCSAFDRIEQGVGEYIGWLQTDNVLLARKGETRHLADAGVTNIGHFLFQELDICALCEKGFDGGWIKARFRCERDEYGTIADIEALEEKGLKQALDDLCLNAETIGKADQPVSKECVGLMCNTVKRKFEAEFAGAFGFLRQHGFDLIGTIGLREIGRAVHALRREIGCDLERIPSDIDGKPRHGTDHGIDQPQPQETGNGDDISDNVDRHGAGIFFTHGKGSCTEGKRKGHQSGTA